MASQDKPGTAQIPNYMKFILGGLAGMSGMCIVQPLDLVKTRMQISAVGTKKKEYKSSAHCIKSIIKHEGLLGLYRGIGASLLRQATYTTGRLGLYTNLNEKYKSNFEREPPLLVRMSMAITAGAFGAFLGTPADLALIRMTADGHLPKELRRNYSNVAVALIRITREEGVATLWRGCLPTVGRAMVVNMAQLASYSHAKAFFMREFGMKEGIPVHFGAAMLSGLLTTMVSMPVDIAKTRVQNMEFIDGKPEYRGAIDVLTKIVKHEGILALWKGFTPYYCRLGPHTVLTLMFLEQFNKFYFKYVMGTSGTSSL